MIKRVGLITTSPEILQGEDVDLDVIIPALEEMGMASEPLIWHAGNTDWSRFDLLVMRSPWDYPERLDEFLEWLHFAEGKAPILNSPQLIKWNLDKKYLLELASLGVDIVPTHIYSSAGEVADSLASMQEEVVIKPTISVGSRNTGRYSPVCYQEALHLASRIVDSGKQVILQPCISEVSRQGEHSLLYFGGTFSHAICKGPILAENGGYLGGIYTEEISPATASQAEITLADQAIRAITTICQEKEAPLYARFDIVNDNGTPLLLEAELFEPSYFLSTSPGSAHRFALAVKGRLVASQ